MKNFTPELGGKPPVKPHAVPREIKDVSPSDVFVRVMGVVVEVAESHMVIDDGTGMIKVVLSGDGPPLSIGKLVRVFGSVSQNKEGGIYVCAEIIQDMSALDLELYKKVKKIKKYSFA